MHFLLDHTEVILTVTGFEFGLGKESRVLSCRNLELAKGICIFPTFFPRVTTCLGTLRRQPLSAAPPAGPDVRGFLNPQQPVSLSLLQLEITWLDPKNIIAAAKMNEKKQDKRKLVTLYKQTTDGRTFQWRSVPSNSSCLFFRKKKKKSLKTFWKNPPTPEYCVQKNLLFLKCPCSKRTT